MRGKRAPTARRTIAWTGSWCGGRWATSPRRTGRAGLDRALTSLDACTGYGRLRAGLRRHFNEEQVAVLTVTAAMINLWNRVQIGSH